MVHGDRLPSTSFHLYCSNLYVCTWCYNIIAPLNIYDGAIKRALQRFALCATVTPVHLGVGLKSECIL